MPVAQRFWGEQVPDGFAPRFETTMNWARGYGFVPAEEDYTFDVARDLLAARVWLERAGLKTQADLFARRLIEAAAQLAKVAMAVPPQARSAWAVQARAVVTSSLDAPALAHEAAIARVALEWVAASAYPTDALFSQDVADSLDLLVVLQGFHAEPLQQSLAQRLGERALVWSLVEEIPLGAVSLHAASDAADEAERAAACVLSHLQAGRTPVALAATDRVLTRRIRALLELAGVAIRDETGWKLSTTRAAANVMAALKACAWDASSDQVLEWLKSAPALGSSVVLGLERKLRKAGLREWRLMQASDWGESKFLAEAAGEIGRWRGQMQRARPLHQWLPALRELLQACGQWTALAHDAAGARVLDALRLREAQHEEFLALAEAAHRFDLHEFTAWVSDVLEAASFTPERAGDEQVVVLPFAQLLGRDFAALVLPGCDEQRLPAVPEPPGHWTAAQREALGLPTRELLETEQRSAWQLALATPYCDVLWRTGDNSAEALLPSPLVQSLQLNCPAGLASDTREVRQLKVEPQTRPRAEARMLVLTQLSASAYEDLRRCPYRFFALRLLGLKEADEIDNELDKRDFGTWLHAVLKRYQESLRELDQPRGSDRAGLLDRIACEVTQAHRLAEGEFLPFMAVWPAVRDAYLEWQAEHEASGAVFVEAENEHRRELGPVTLIGRIDRMDRLRDGMPIVMDYKTEALEVTRERVRQPQEDTQLAFYGALLEQQPLRATYVNLAERGKVRMVEQESVVETREQLIEGILSDLQRIGQGEALIPLGEGITCDYCAARGLCRKDFWHE